MNEMRSPDLSLVEAQSETPEAYVKVKDLEVRFVSREATVKAVSTELAWERQGTLLSELLPAVERLPIPDGATEDELWQIFNVLVAAIPAGETVIFDITHGFRSQPVLSLLVASFLRVAKGIRLEALLYGAYERDRENSPVFDLTPFVAMLDWANATERFLETGDARKIASLIREQRKSPLNSVAARLTDLSEALALARPMLVTEHGIYTKERRIEVDRATWIESADDGRELASRSAPYFRRWWNRMFSGMSQLAYAAAEEILTIHHGNTALQLAIAQLRCDAPGVAQLAGQSADSGGGSATLAP